MIADNVKVEIVRATGIQGLVTKLNQKNNNFLKCYIFLN